MAYNKELAERVRIALAKCPLLGEKKMFRGVAFMVDGKMCITVGDNEIMCRIDPLVHERAILKKGCRSAVMKGRELKGWVLINEEGMSTTKDFEYWIHLSLDYNKRAKHRGKKQVN